MRTSIRQPDVAGRLLLIGWIALIAIVASSRIVDTDPYWQARNGQELLDGGSLARPDTWSWAPVDGLFYPNSPLWNVTLAIGWDTLGFWGLFLISVLSISGALAAIAWLSFRLGASPLAIVGTVVLAGLASLPLLSPRGALPAITLMLVAIGSADVWAGRASRQGALVNASATLVAGLLLSTLGNWVHVSWSTNALAVAAAWMVIWWLGPTLPLASRVALSVGGTVGLSVGILLGPYGSEVRARAATVLEASGGLITEWMSPFTAGFGPRWWPLGIAVALFVVIAAGLCAHALRTHGRGPRLALASGLVVATIPYAMAGLLFVRFIPMSALLVSPLAAVSFTRLFIWLGRSAADPPPSAGYVRGRLPEWVSTRFWRVILTATLIVLAPLAVVLSLNHATPATSEINAMLPAGCREFGTPIDSASIILTRPDVQVWIDNRADYWGRDRITQAQGYLYRVDQATLIPPGTTCIVLSDAAADPAISPLIEALDADPDWERVSGTVGGSLWLPSGGVAPTVP